jgi:hypothetical protein
MDETHARQIANQINGTTDYELARLVLMLDLETAQAIYEELRMRGDIK